MYYAVHRTEALQTITREIAEINFSDLLLYEAFHTMRTLTLGKVHLDEWTISYYRQHGTTSSGPSAGTWSASFLRSNFTADAAAMEKIIPGTTEALEEKLRQFLCATFCDWQRLKWRIQDRYPGIYWAMQNRWHYFAWLESWRCGGILKTEEWERISEICRSLRY